jgi:catechol-2,3-dioxygenase
MRHAAFVCTLVVSLATACATGPRAITNGPAGQGTFFALSVGDVAAMSRWYQDTLGLRVRVSGEAPNKIAKFAILEGSSALVELIQHSKASDRAVVAPSATEAHMIHGVFKVGMIVGDLDALYARIKQRGIAVAYELMPAKDLPLRSFTIRDPEGNLVQFFGV